MVFICQDIQSYGGVFTAAVASFMSQGWSLWITVLLFWYEITFVAFIALLPNF